MGTRSLASTELKIAQKATVRNTLTDAQVASVQMGGTAVVNWTLDNGVSEGEANRAWEDKNRELSSGGSEVIDLYDFAGIDIGAGAGNDALGQALILEEIVSILIINSTSSAGDLAVEPDGTAGWSPIGSHTAATGGALPPGGILLKASRNTDAFDITDASSHRIKMTAVGGDVTYDIYILGRNDDDESSSSSSSSSSSQSSSSQSSSSSTSSGSSSSSSSSP